MRPGVGADVPCATLEVSESSREVGGQQLRYQVAGLLLHVPRVLDLPRQDALVQLHAIVGIERRVSARTAQHNAQRA
eukprot:561865-Rhodomonas_salina.2